jgi:hypothetical protein
MNEEIKQITVMELEQYFESLPQSDRVVKIQDFQKILNGFYWEMMIDLKDCKRALEQIRDLSKTPTKTSAKDIASWVLERLGD